jgi:predicted transcriptional regulator of viral defense system
MLAYLQLRRRRSVGSGELVKALRLTKAQESRLFERLTRAGLIAQVRRGLYLVPPRLPLGGAWSPDEILALNTLMADREGRYQICGPNAFHRYGFTDQVPTRTYAYNNRFSGTREIGSVSLSLIKVADERLGDTEKAVTADGEVAIYSSRARTLVDAVYDWSRFDSLPRAFEWIRSELEARTVTAGRLIETTLAYGDIGTRRRIGALLERQGVDTRLLRRLERSLPDSTSLIAWIPTRPKRGRVDSRWGVVINEPG